jgi:hypothetical protein
LSERKEMPKLTKVNVFYLFERSGSFSIPALCARGIARASQDLILGTLGISRFIWVRKQDE